MKNRIKFVKNDKAVSPVIGVILMVAITVILAAIIAAFVFGMGTPTKTPQASLVISKATTANNGYVTLEHKGGDSIALKDVKIIATQAGNSVTWDPTSSTTIDATFSVTQFLNLSNLNATSGQLVYVGASKDSGTSTGATVSGALNGGTGSYYFQANKNLKLTLIYNPSGQKLVDIEVAVGST